VTGAGDVDCEGRQHQSWSVATIHTSEELAVSEVESSAKRGSALFDLSGKRAVVVGGTTGIGRALSVGLGAAGADVVATGRRMEPLEETTRAIESLGRRTLRQTADVSDRASLVALRDRVVNELGPVDVLVNCAGRIRRVPTLEIEESEWNSVVDTNLTGTLRSCQVFAREMLDRGAGRIINIASLNSFVSFHEVASYAASKAGVAALTRSLAVEWSRRGVLVNAIAPGVFRTALNQQLLDSTPRGQELLMRTPQGRFGRVEELVGAAVFLASDAASYVTGVVLPVDGGFLASGVNQ
jgi:NAD(P)-dependent dehydrogenase (short-subunit alcohol dehydrogenase family)